MLFTIFFRMKCFRWLTVMVLFELSLLVLCVCVAADFKEINILNLFYSTGGPEHSHITSINAGLNAALASDKFDVANGFKIKLLSIEKNDWSSNFSDVIEK
ncbi:uncharacterized protein TM35_002811000, partial [Trypanosoma theileri]